MKSAAKRKINFAAWEISLNYENVIKAIGRNRKTIDIKLSALEKLGIPIDFGKAKEVIAEVLSASGIRVQEEHWPLLLKFAEKEGLIDYKFLLEIYRGRVETMVKAPRPPRRR